MARARVFTVGQRELLRSFLTAYLEAHPCVDCGESDPIVLEFDHDRSQPKLFNIGEAVTRAMSIKTLSAEIAKCEVRCANCHRRKTRREQYEKVRTAKAGDYLPLFDQ